jgi:hypothetical protein
VCFYRGACLENPIISLTWGCFYLWKSKYICIRNVYKFVVTSVATRHCEQRSLSPCRKCVFTVTGKSNRPPAIYDFIRRRKHVFEDSSFLKEKQVFVLLRPRQTFQILNAHGGKTLHFPVPFHFPQCKHLKTDSV